MAEVDAVPALELFPREKLNPAFVMPEYLRAQSQLAKIRPPAAVRTFDEFLKTEGHDSEKERAALAEITLALQAQPYFDSVRMDEWFIARYAIARNFDKKKVLAMVEKTVAWRKERDWDAVRCEKCDVDPSRHFLQFAGWDLLHRPVMFTSMAHAPDRSCPMESIVHSVEAFNTCIRHMPVGVTKWVNITNFISYSYFTDANPKIANAVTGVMADHFPERLGMMILVDPPSAFWIFWKVFSPLIDAKTRAKVLFVYTDSKPSIDDEFPKIFPPHLSEYLITTYRRLKDESKNKKK